MSNLLNNAPTIIAAVISGIIGLIIVLIQNVIPNIKYKFEVRSNFNDLLKDKLEKVYSPLIIMLLKTNQCPKFISEDVENIISNYAHLLSKDLLKDLLDIYKIEQSLDSELQNNLLIQEHKNIKVKILEKVNNEFNELQNTFNKDFRDKKERLFIPWYKKIFRTITFICIFITVIFYIILITISFLSSLKPFPNITKNPLLNTLTIIITLIIIATSMILMLYVPQVFFDKLNEIRRKQKRYYTSYEYVLDTGYYKCRVCNQNRIYVIKGSRLPKCKEHNFKQKLKSIGFIYNWGFDQNQEEN